jgi:hypothetical protein
LSKSQINTFNFKKKSEISTFSAKGIDPYSELKIFKNIVETKSVFKNYDKILFFSKQSRFLNHPSSNVILADKSIRAFIKNTPQSTLLNFKNLSFQPSNNFLPKPFFNDNFGDLLFLINSKTHFLDHTTFSKLKANSVNSDFIGTPVTTISRNKFILNYDQTRQNNKNFGSILQGKEEIIPVGILSFY